MVTLLRPWCERTGALVAVYVVVVVVVVAVASGCSRTPPRAPASRAPVEAPPASDDAGESAASDELEPGELNAFGLALPLGAQERLGDATQKMYYVTAPLPRVMRYLQRRLEIVNAEIHPRGAMVRNARLRDAAPGSPHAVDVGVREEGDRVLVTVWDRTRIEAPPRTSDEGLRAAGIDPRTGRPLPQNNY